LDRGAPPEGRNGAEVLLLLLMADFCELLDKKIQAMYAAKMA
jgi:hypothetical protein